MVPEQTDGFNCGIFQIRYLQSLYLDGGIESLTVVDSEEWTRESIKALFKVHTLVINIFDELMGLVGSGECT